MNRPGWNIGTIPHELRALCTDITVHNVNSVQTRPDLTITDPALLKVIADETRTRILQVLEDRPASAKQLSQLLEMSHGRVGYHINVLAKHNLVEVVESRQVRALTEKLYAPTFGRMRVQLDGEAPDRLGFMFAQAAREAAPAAAQPFEETGRLYATRMPTDRAAEFLQRLIALADEFAGAEGDGPMFGFAGSVYLVDMPGETT